MRILVPHPRGISFFPLNIGDGERTGTIYKVATGNFGEGESFHFEGFWGIFPANPLDTGKGTGNIFI